MKFEDKLIKLRKKEIMSQEELAEKLNVTRQTISKWELGQSKPDMDKLVEISKLFEVPIDNLTNDELDIESSINVKKSEKKERKWLLYVLVIALIVLIVSLVIRINLQKEQEKSNAKNDTGIFSIFDNMFGMFNNMSKEIQDQYQESVNEMDKKREERLNEMNDKSTKSRHNAYFELYTGTKPALFVETALDNIISVNKKDKEHMVTLVYNDIATTEEVKIKEIKHSLEDFDEYEISIEYDDNGYVNKVILEDI